VRAASPAEFDALAQADKRARNIITKSPNSAGGALLADRTAFCEPAEHKLLDAVEICRGGVESLAAKRQFRAALELTMRVSAPVTEFFEHVMVNADDARVRANRFNLLHQLLGLTNRVADLSKLAA
jgi:glycyl-tRNA synthetase beta chain